MEFDLQNELRLMREAPASQSEKKPYFNEGFFPIIKHFYEKYISRAPEEIERIHQFATLMDNSMLFRIMMYARDTNNPNIDFIEEKIFKIQQKNIKTLQELNEALGCKP